jgi:hypothetical protein
VNSTACTCAGLDFSGAPGGVTFDGSSVITIHGGITYKNGMTITYSGSITIDTSCSITSNGAEFSAYMSIVVDGSGITVTIADTFNFPTVYLYVSQGTLAIGSQTVTCLAIGDNGSSLTKSITFSGSPTLTCSYWYFPNSGFTITPASSIIKVNGSTGFRTLGQTYYEVQMTTSGYTPLYGNNTFTNLQLLGRAVIGESINLVDNQTVTGTFTLTGFAANQRLSIQPDTPGTQRTITLTGATVNATNVDLQDIVYAGSPTQNATRVGDCGNNTGVTVTTGVNKYLVTGNASVNWGTGTVWATTDGGGTNINNFPLPQDTAIINNNSWTDNTAYTLTVNSAIDLSGFDFSALTRTAKTFTISNAVSCFGDMKLTTTAMTLTSNASIITLAKRGTQNITTAGRTWGNAFTIDNINGTVNLLDDFAQPVDRPFVLTSGNFVDNGHAITSTRSWASTGTATRSVTKTGGWTIAGTTVICFNNDKTGMTWSDTAGSINITSAGAHTFAGGGLSYNTLNFAPSTVGQILTITGANSFGTLQTNNGAVARNTILLKNGITQTIETLSIDGANSTYPTYLSSSASSVATISKASGTVSLNNVSLLYSAATGGATFNAYTANGCVNRGGCTGWNFSGSVTTFVPQIIMF